MIKMKQANEIVKIMKYQTTNADYSESSPLDPTGLKQLTRKNAKANPTKIEANTIETLNIK